MQPLTAKPHARPAPATRRTKPAPEAVRRSSPLVGWLLRRGLPMGPNTLLTVRGRRSGQPRTVPVAVVEVDGRRWVIGAYGEVQWVRNLRAAGEGEIRMRGTWHPAWAVELSRQDAEAFFRDTLQPYVSRLPRAGRAVVGSLFRLVDARAIFDDAAAAAERFPVFELIVPSGAGTPPTGAHEQP